MTELKYFQHIKLKFVLNAETQVNTERAVPLCARGKKLFGAKIKLSKMLKSCSLSLQATCIQKCKYRQKTFIWSTHTHSQGTQSGLTKESVYQKRLYNSDEFQHINIQKEVFNLVGGLNILTMMIYPIIMHHFCACNLLWMVYLTG